MKKIFLLVATCTCLYVQGQFKLQPRVGLNENKHFVFAMDMAYRFKNVEGAVIINDVQSTREAAYFGYRAGYAIPLVNDIKVMPFAGRSFRYMSNDKLSENYWVWNYGVRVEKDIVFIQAEYVNQFQLTIGAKF